jgi:hypothetical protein
MGSPFKVLSSGLEEAHSNKKPKAQSRKKLIAHRRKAIASRKPTIIGNSRIVNFPSQVSCTYPHVTKI